MPEGEEAVDEESEQYEARKWLSWHSNGSSSMHDDEPDLEGEDRMSCSRKSRGSSCGSRVVDPEEEELLPHEPKSPTGKPSRGSSFQAGRNSSIDRSSSSKPATAGESRASASSTQGSQQRKPSFTATAPKGPCPSARRPNPVLRSSTMAPSSSSVDDSQLHLQSDGQPVPKRAARKCTSPAPSTVHVESDPPNVLDEDDRPQRKNSRSWTWRWGSFNFKK